MRRTVCAMMAFADVGPMPNTYCTENSTILLFGISTPPTRAATTCRAPLFLFACEKNSPGRIQASTAGKLHCPQVVFHSLLPAWEGKHLVPAWPAECSGRGNAGHVPGNLRGTGWVRPDIPALYVLVQDTAATAARG